MGVKSVGIFCRDQYRGGKVWRNAGLACWWLDAVLSLSVYPEAARGGPRLPEASRGGTLLLHFIILATIG